MALFTRKEITDMVNYEIGVLAALELIDELKKIDPPRIKKMLEMPELEKIVEAMRKLTPFYAQALVLHKEKAKGERYTEIIAEELLEPDNLNILKNIPMVDRRKSYRVLTKGKPHKRPDITERPDKYTAEKWTAKFLFGEKLGALGKIIDFQTPLKAVQKDNAGEIDLLSCNGKDVYIIELKKHESTETLLRCVLEIFTYSRQVNQAKLLSDFGIPDNNPDKSDKLRKAVLVFEKSQAYKDFEHNGTEVRKLMKELGVDLFVLDVNIKDICDREKHCKVMEFIRDKEPIKCCFLHEDL